MANVVHDLKCWPIPFEAMKDGSKTAEFRKDDRDYEVGDTLLLREWSPVKGYSGASLSFEITHVLRGEFGVPEGYAMLSLRSQVTEPTPQLQTAIAALDDAIDHATNYCGACDTCERLSGVLHDLRCGKCAPPGAVPEPTPAVTDEQIRKEAAGYVGAQEYADTTDEDALEEVECAFIAGAKWALEAALGREGEK